jgi:hypothetical protein
MTSLFPDLTPARISRLARSCGVYPIGKMLARRGVPIRQALSLIKGESFCVAEPRTARPQRSEDARNAAQAEGDFEAFSNVGFSVGRVVAPRISPVNGICI